jgi:uncharacterized protein
MAERTRAAPSRTRAPGGSKTRKLFALALGLLALACERIEEPPPPRKEPGKRPPERCIHPTAETPKRYLAQPGPDPSCPADDQPDAPKLRAGKVIFTEANGAAVTVEIAEKNDERNRGLMFRKSLPEDHGMIFVFPRSDVHRFWMRNTCLPLDMVFVDGDGYVVGIEENTTTMSDAQFYVPCPSRYVVEVNAGYCRRHGVRAGQRVKLEGI